MYSCVRVRTLRPNIPTWHGYHMRCWHIGENKAIIDGYTRVFDKEDLIDEWHNFRTDELWPRRHMSWRPMCKELLLDESIQEKYPNICFLLMTSLVFMLSNACCERGFSLQNHIKGPRSTRMDTSMLSYRIRVASQAPSVSSADALAFVEDITDTYWASFKSVPARAISARASAQARRKRGRQIAATKEAAKTARIDGSSNMPMGDDCVAIAPPRRVEFASENFQVKETQPAQINGSLVGGMMAKLMVTSEEDGTRKEWWEVGRVKNVKTVRVTLPEGGTTVSSFLFHWQAFKFDSRGRASLSGDVLTDLQLDLLSCGRTREWAMVEPKHVAPKSRAGRPKSKKTARQGGHGS